MADEAAADDDERIVEIIENLELGGYPADEIDVTDDGQVIVGGDAIVSLAASREIAGEALAASDGSEESEESIGFRQYRTNNTVSGAIDLICLIDDPWNSAPLNRFRTNAMFSTALNQTINRYNARNLSFQLQRRHKGNTGGCDATIKMRVENPAGVGGVSGFPSGGQPFDRVTVFFKTRDFGAAVLRHVTMHEVGHTLGLRHSDYFDRSISCGGPTDNEGAGPFGAKHIFGTPTGATPGGSVMNSCFSPSENGEFKNSDRKALQWLYAPFVVSKNSQFNAGLNGWIDGGDDAARVIDNTHCAGGSSCLRIRDDSGAASSFRTTIDATGKLRVRVTFRAKPVGVENGKRFRLQINTGSGWTTLEQYVVGTDINNNQAKTLSLTRNRAMNSNTRFRFIADGANDTDRFFIDNVKIEVK